MTEENQKKLMDLVEVMTSNMEVFQQQQIDAQNNIIMLRKRIEKIEFQIFNDIKRN